MSDTTKQRAGTASRRAVISGVGAVGLAIGVAACGSSNGNGTPPSTTTTTPGTGPTGDAQVQAAPIKTEDIPVGGGKIFAGDDTVVTQPKKGDFKAFSATCTHQGCTVASITGGTINCPCHGSRYSIEDGSVKHPATGLTIATQDPLPAKAVTVKGDVIEVT